MSLSDASTLDGGASLSHTWCRRLTDGHGAVPSLAIRRDLCRYGRANSLCVAACNLSQRQPMQDQLANIQLSQCIRQGLHLGKCATCRDTLQFPAGPTERYHHSSLFSREGLFHQVTNESFLAVSICKNATDGGRSTQRFCVSPCTMRLALQDTETCL